ncbi:MAG: alpha-L-fucosidase [Rhizomicrobium sp.]|nr:alpha-L-fucosidase [Rhizomicrobium sp.]
MSGRGITKRKLFKQAAVLGLAAGLPTMARAEGIAESAAGPFAANWDSLIAGYQAPEWFRDAKFGLWAHWGPQCAAEAGDWYARQMYVQGQGQYDHHLKHYGHPADTGFMDVIQSWKAENFNPDALLDLYVKAGAKYFVALANHHDNFDTYASKFHAWNATQVGPKRDLLGMFAKAARARGLRFGVSNHSAHAWHWFQTAYGYDPEGPRRGERYDAFRLTKAMGKGKWWEGLDPQELYAGRVMPLPDGFTDIKAAVEWHEQHDRVWNENPPAANPAFTRAWYLRCKDLIDTYQPDLVYFDNFDLPLGQAGLDIAAHFYNASIKWHGKLEAVINTKSLPPERRAAVVEDVERGFRAEVQPHPWQTDTCIGEWHYNRALYERNGYKSAASVIHRLCDVVAKNGNLLVSVPVRGDGTIDEKEQAIVEGIGSWMGRFSEAIYGTRPWKRAGEGPTQVTSGQFGEASVKPFTAADVRFTTKDGALYALTLGRPETSTFTLASLKGYDVARVEVVGTTAPLTFQQGADGLTITLPSQASHEFGVAFKILGKGIA